MHGIQLFYKAFGYVLLN